MTKQIGTSVMTFLLGQALSHGANFSANPTMDAFVTTGPTGNLVDNNYGGAGSLTVAAGGLEMGEAQSVLQFNLAGAVSAFNTQFGVGQWSVESVTLQLSAANANNPIFNSPLPGIIGISWMRNDIWQEGSGSPSSPGTTGVTFTSLQGMLISSADENLGSFNFNGGTSGANVYSLGLTSGLINDIQVGDPLSLRLFAADNTVAGVFNSRNFSIAANRPLLTVVAVPEPGTITLAALGLALLGVRTLRARKARH
jgi:PEP-CTERM motif-containing protein